MIIVTYGLMKMLSLLGAETGATATAQEFATALGGILTLDKFLGALTILVPVIGGVLIFAFIYGRTKRLTSGAQNGKAKI